MSKVFIKFSSIVFLTFSAIKSGNATTYKTENNNFSLTYNNITEVADVTLSPSFTANNPGIDSFWLVSAQGGVIQKGVKLIGDIENNAISAYVYNRGSVPDHGLIVNNTTFDDGVIGSPTAPWNTIPKGQLITDGWTVTGGDINLKDAQKSIAVGTPGPDTIGKHIDLDGESPGTISKTLRTEAGKTYTLTFNHAASPAVDTAVNPNWKADKEFKIRVGDQEAGFISKFDENDEWKRETVTFTAVSDTTEISFISSSTGTAGRVRTGTYLDDIRISQDTNDGEYLATVYGAIKPNGDGFSFDLTDINQKITALGGKEFEIDTTASIMFKSGTNSEFVYVNQDLARYNATYTNVADYNCVPTEVVPVSEPLGLLATLTAISLFFVTKRRKNKTTA